MRDFLGFPVKVTDFVVVQTKHYRSFSVAYIIKITNTGIQVLYLNNCNRLSKYFTKSFLLIRDGKYLDTHLTEKMETLLKAVEAKEK